MKLGALKSAIRAAPNVGIQVRVGAPIPFRLLLRKDGLLTMLDEAFPDGKAQETDLCLVDNTWITREISSDD